MSVVEPAGKHRKSLPEEASTEENIDAGLTVKTIFD